MDTKNDLVMKLKDQCAKGGPLCTPGHHNDDSVNLAILAWVDMGEADSWQKLHANVLAVADSYMIEVSDDIDDQQYLVDKCKVLMDYLPNWGPHPNEDEAIAYAID